MDIYHWRCATLVEVSSISAYSHLEAEVLRLTTLGMETVQFHVSGVRPELWKRILARSFPTLHKRGIIVMDYDGKSYTISRCDETADDLCRNSCSNRDVLPQSFGARVGNFSVA